MRLTKTRIAAEIVGLLVVLIFVQWLTTVLLHTRAFWPLVTYSMIHLSVRAAWFARKTRERAH